MIEETIPIGVDIKNAQGHEITMIDNALYTHCTRLSPNNNGGINATQIVITIIIGV